MLSSASKFGRFTRWPIFLSRLVGLWDMLCGPVHSVVELRSDGSYAHAFPLAARQHWGHWGLSQQNGCDWLVLSLTGAEPMMEFGPFGPQPIPWPQMEAWAIQDVGDKVCGLIGARLIRMNQQPQPIAPPVFAPFLAPIRADEGGKKMVAGLDVSSLGIFQHPPPSSAPVMSGWQSVLAGMVPQLNPGAQIPAGPAIGGAAPQTASVDFSQINQSRNDAFQRSQSLIKQQSDASHAIAQQWASYAGS